MLSFIIIPVRSPFCQWVSEVSDRRYDSFVGLATLCLLLLLNVA